MQQKFNVTSLCSTFKWNSIFLNLEICVVHILLDRQVCQQTDIAFYIYNILRRLSVNNGKWYSINLTEIGTKCIYKRPSQSKYETYFYIIQSNNSAVYTLA